ncbi:MAG: ABC transporter substrate-binding protein, partial [Anaerolineae bacterium]
MPVKLLLLNLALLLAVAACNPAPGDAGLPVATPTLLPPLARVVDINPNAIVIPIPIDPPSFNAYINDTGYEELIGELVFGALAELGPDGRYYPELAAEVPTLQNGGLSADGLTVTWHLRPGLVWSDGEPFTAADVVFTWQALRQSGVYAPGFDLIADVETPDDLTVILHYSEFYPNYRLQFGGEGTGIFPAHQCDPPDKMLVWDCNVRPVSLGPFVLAEWQEGKRLVFNPNPNYWLPGRPLAEQLIFVIEADPNRRQRMLQRENAHLDLWVEEPQLSQLEESDAALILASDPARFVLRLVPNLSRFGSADAAQPHPILADLAVRQAIRHAINVPLSIEEVFNNRALPADTELARNGCTVTPYAYNPQTADALLTRAGWIDRDEDGTRECHGCGNAPAIADRARTIRA